MATARFSLIEWPMQLGGIYIRIYADSIADPPSSPFFYACVASAIDEISFSFFLIHLCTQSGPSLLPRNVSFALANVKLDKLSGFDVRMLYCGKRCYFILARIYKYILSGFNFIN